MSAESKPRDPPSCPKCGFPGQVTTLVTYVPDRKVTGYRCRECGREWSA